MKILIITHFSDFFGGANRSLMGNILRFKNEKQVDITVLLPGKTGSFNSRLDELNIPWIDSGYLVTGSGAQHDGKDFLRHIKVFFSCYYVKIKAKRIAESIKTDGFDLVYTNTRLTMLGAEIANILNVPHVLHVRETCGTEPIWGKWNYTNVNKYCNKVIVISDSVQNLYKKYVPKKNLILSYNGLDYKCEEYKEKTLTKNINFVIIGRLAPEKGHFDALRAINRIVKQNLTEKNIVLTIVGGAGNSTSLKNYEKKLKTFVRNNALEKNIIFYGESENVREIRTRMDFEMVCSTFEPFGRVTVEAMRSTLFVIGANTGGTLDLIQDNSYGLLYEQGNYTDLAQKMCSVIDDNQFYNKIRKDALEYSKENFTIDKNFNDIYKTCVSVMK